MSITWKRDWPCEAKREDYVIVRVRPVKLVYLMSIMNAKQSISKMADSLFKYASIPAEYAILIYTYAMYY